MSIIAHAPDDTGRLTLALLLALGLHAALLLGIPADWWSIRFPKPLRFDVVLLPPAERANTSTPASAPASAAPEAHPGATAAVVAIPEPVITPLEPAPTTPPELAPAAVPPPAPIPQPHPPAATKPEPPIPPPTSAIKPPTKPPAPIKSPTAVKAAPASRVVTTRVAPPQPAKSPEKSGADLPDKSPVKPRKTAPIPVKPNLPATTTSATAPEPTRSTRRSGRIERGGATASTGARGRLDSGALLGQIAGIETETQQRANTGERSKRVNPNDTQSLEGFYIAAWMRKVEQIGEMNFPDVARKLNLNAGPVLDVSIRADGSLKDVRVTRSSGNTELDRAAQRIVKLGAPYSPFPPQLRQQYDVLYISRPWRFEAQGRVRAR